jgi:hypothetical protein
MAYVAAGILLRELTAGFSQSCVAATDKAEAITATAVIDKATHSAATIIMSSFFIFGSSFRFKELVFRVGVGEWND